MNLFVAVIPLLILGYAFLEAFNPNHTVGALIVRNLHLTGSTAHVVRDTFASAQSGKSVALSISLISLLITGLDVSATAQLAYARAFSMPPLRGLQKYLRGGAWLILLLADTGAALTLRALAASRPLWFALITAAVLLALEFGFFLVTPRLLLDRPFAWRDLVPGAAVCTVAGAIVHAVAVFFLRNWFAEYGNAYGAFGVGLALIAALGIIASLGLDRRRHGRLLGTQSGARRGRRHGGTISGPQRDANQAMIAAARWRIRSSSPSRRATASLPRRSCCAGTCSRDGR
jgi:uncharacterized BrkB/YihY/UPF0761 family membrane protein